MHISFNSKGNSNRKSVACLKKDPVISLFTWVIFAPYVKVKVVIWSNAMLS